MVSNRYQHLLELFGLYYLRHNLQPYGLKCLHLFSFLLGICVSFYLLRHCCEATLKEPLTSADKPIDHQCKHNADHACDRDMDRQSEGEDKEAEIKHDGGTQPEGLPVIQKRSLKIRTDKSSYHKSDKHQ